MERIICIREGNLEKIICVRERKPAALYRLLKEKISAQVIISELTASSFISCALNTLELDQFYDFGSHEGRNRTLQRISSSLSHREHL